MILNSLSTNAHGLRLCLNTPETFPHTRALIYFTHLILIQNEDQELQDLWTKLKAKTPEYFAGLDIKPSLLHGDLWGGNVGEIDSGPGIYL